MPQDNAPAATEPRGARIESGSTNVQREREHSLDDVEKLFSEMFEGPQVGETSEASESAVDGTTDR